MRLPLLALLLATLLAAGACASAGTGATRPGRDVITLDEIQASSQVNAYEIIRMLRPGWLRTRGPTSVYNENPIVVYVDGVRLGGPEELVTIPAINVQRMRRYDAPEAQARWGFNHSNGAIEVITKRG
jgi:hypothetical protein